jgi:GDP-4-dehydro-6-deoxy-D-mannose reductase
MRVLVTGATGFVGRWLMEELRRAGHETILTPPSAQLDITDASAVRGVVGSARPDAVAHLAGVSHAMDAARDPATAMLVNEGGTRNVLEAVRFLDRHVPVLVTGSSEVYGAPDPADLPLTESAPTRTTKPYGLSKLAQERTTLELGDRHGIPVAVTRSFNHTGPGQRPEFVAAAFARRVRAAKRDGRSEVAVGNLAVERDIGDVRDFARAYRLLLEGLAAGSIETGQAVNVATGRATAIGDLLAILGRLAGIEPVPVVDETQLRAGDPPRIVGDASLVRRLTGWQPEVPLERTLRDLLSSLDQAIES